MINGIGVIRNFIAIALAYYVCDAMPCAMLILSIVTFKVMIIIMIEKEEECICIRERILEWHLNFDVSVEF